MNVLKVLDRPIAFQRHFVSITGTINAALMLSQAVYWSQRTTLPNGWFYKTQPEWEDETGLTRREQDGARKILLACGLIAEEKRGVPAKIHYQVQVEKLEELCTETPREIGTKQPNCTHQNAKPKAPKRQRNTETTTETTSETSLPKDKPSVDEPSLHTLFRNDYGAYFEHKNKCPAPWDAKEASRLSKWMKSNPTITRDQWRAILTNRARSPVGHAKPLSVWIGVAVGWLNGPADDWGKAIVNGGTNGAVPTGKADRNMAILQQSLNRGKRQGGANEDGMFSSGGDGRNDARKLHAGTQGT